MSGGNLSDDGSVALSKRPAGCVLTLLVIFVIAGLRFIPGSICIQALPWSLPLAEGGLTLQTDNCQGVQGLKRNHIQQQDSLTMKFSLKNWKILMM